MTATSAGISLENCEFAAPFGPTVHKNYKTEAGTKLTLWRMPGSKWAFYDTKAPTIADVEAMLKRRQ